MTDAIDKPFYYPEWYPGCNDQGEMNSIRAEVFALQRVHLYLDTPDMPPLIQLYNAKVHPTYRVKEDMAMGHLFPHIMSSEHRSHRLCFVECVFKLHPELVDRAIADVESWRKNKFELLAYLYTFKGVRYITDCPLYEVVLNIGRLYRYFDDVEDVLLYNLICAKLIKIPLFADLRRKNVRSAMEAVVQYMKDHFTLDELFKAGRIICYDLNAQYAYFKHNPPTLNKVYYARKHASLYQDKHVWSGCKGFGCKHHMSVGKRLVLARYYQWGAEDVERFKL
ncbi:ORF57 [Ranid herpesvirus 2]|uniref:ORF57 n=1 Tax=Ranid herpesvirus 2 TaxID=389214 RepID=Q14W49_9VIRU|nr:ORF57 [Ranid herpesvirus 2]ABG25657.1 ORF57 [Ranid herpesvirus 2]